jgi:ketosteroid isomerase-like protein
MRNSKRVFLAATGAAGLAAFSAGTFARAGAASDIDQVVARLIQRSEDGNAALLRGDVDTYLDLITLSEDFSLMSPFGGRPSHGGYSQARWKEIGRFFRNGTLRQELVQAYSSADMVVLAVIEHGHGEVGGLPAQDWLLRVTLVYRRDGENWLLVHRHADPLANGISLEQSASLARAKRSE